MRAHLAGCMFQEALSGLGLRYGQYYPGQICRHIKGSWSRSSSFLVTLYIPTSWNLRSRATFACPTLHARVMSPRPPPLACARRRSVLGSLKHCDFERSPVEQWSSCWIPRDGKTWYTTEPAHCGGVFLQDTQCFAVRCVASSHMLCEEYVGQP